MRRYYVRPNFTKFPVAVKQKSLHKEGWEGIIPGQSLTKSKNSFENRQTALFQPLSDRAEGETMNRTGAMLVEHL